MDNFCSVRDTNLAREVVAGPNPDAFSRRARAASEKLVAVSREFKRGNPAGIHEADFFGVR